MFMGSGMLKVGLVLETVSLYIASSGLNFAVYTRLAMNSGLPASAF